MRKVSALPTLLTLGNLLSGFAAITFAARAATGSLPGRGFTEPYSYNVLYAALLVAVAMLCDLFDGRVARATKTTSRFGEEMDSLADLVSFGVAPAFVVKVIIDAHGFPRYYGWVLVAVYVACGSLRLARYNVESAGDSSDTFVGLPIPAAAGASMSWVVLWHALAHGELQSFVGSQSLASLIVKALPFYCFALGPLMASRVRYIHLGKRLFRGEQSFAVIVGIVLLIALIALQPQVMVAGVFNLYVAVGAAAAAVRFASRRRRRQGGIRPDDAGGQTRSGAPSTEKEAP